MFVIGQDWSKGKAKSTPQNSTTTTVLFIKVQRLRLLNYWYDNNNNNNLNVIAFVESSRSLSSYYKTVLLPFKRIITKKTTRTYKKKSIGWFFFFYTNMTSNRTRGKNKCYLCTKVKPPCRVNLRGLGNNNALRARAGIRIFVYVSISTDRTIARYGETVFFRPCATSASCDTRNVRVHTK